MNVLYQLWARPSVAGLGEGITGDFDHEGR